MVLTFAPGDIIQVDDGKIIYRNFSGIGSKYNREGDRNFGLIIETEEMANELSEKGWNVRIRKSKEDDEPSLIFLPVKIKFNGSGPNVYLVSGKKQRKLDEDTIDVVDDIDIISADMDIRPYDWEVNGKQGRTAYLQSMRIVHRVDRFAEELDNE